MVPRTVARIDDQTWSVPTAGTSSLTFSYKVFGNDLSGTFSQLDERHANYNGGCIFMYIVDHKPDPVKLNRSTRRVANYQRSHGACGSNRMGVSNWDIMIDTPTEVAPDWTLDEFQVDAKKYHVMVHSFGAEGGKRPALVKDIEK
jgi:predicted metalloprotease with PDZ domain